MNLSLPHLHQLLSGLKLSNDLGKQGLQPCKENPICGIANSQPDNRRPNTKFHFLLREIFILRDKHPTALSGKVSDTAVVGLQKSRIPYRTRGMAPFSKPLRQCRRQLRIHQEAHRSSGCQNWMIRVPGSVSDRGPDILSLQIGEVLQDLFLGGSSGKHIQNILHTDAHSTDAGTPSALRGIESNALHTNISTPTRSPRQPPPPNSLKVFSLTTSSHGIF